jgi:hypothetical protein
MTCVFISSFAITLPQDVRRPYSNMYRWQYFADCGSPIAAPFQIPGPSQGYWFRLRTRVPPIIPDLLYYLLKFGCAHVFVWLLSSLNPSYDRQINIMAGASSSSRSSLDPLARPVAFLVSDQELPNDGHSVASSCVLRKYVGHHGVSRDCLSVAYAVARQFPSGDFFPVTAAILGHILEHLSVFTREQYAEIARAHSVRFISVDRKDHIRDLLVHECTTQCAQNLIVYRNFRSPRHYISRVVLPPPSKSDHLAHQNAVRRAARHTTNTTSGSLMRVGHSPRNE